jgi:hypothetical protein
VSKKLVALLGSSLIQPTSKVNPPAKEYHRFYAKGEYHYGDRLGFLRTNTNNTNLLFVDDLTDLTKKIEGNVFERGNFTPYKT